MVSVHAYLYTPISIYDQFSDKGTNKEQKMDCFTKPIYKMQNIYGRQMKLK
jgi:hypothetical protein